jgi:hypothetical protein
MASISLKEATEVLGPHGRAIATLRPALNGHGFEVELADGAVAVKQEPCHSGQGDGPVYQFFLDLDTGDWAEVLYGIY